jgi:hypothetical protein
VCIYGSRHFLGIDLGGFDDPRASKLLLEKTDAMLEERLLILGIVIFGVLANVPELASLTDAFGYLLTLDGREVADLVLELLETIFGENDFFSRHEYLP